MVDDKDERMSELEMEVRAHFNEPMLSGWEIGRCVGYAEDESDNYIIISFPNGSKRSKVWATLVGGYTWLSSLRNKGVWWMPWVAKRS